MGLEHTTKNINRRMLTAAIESEPGVNPGGDYTLFSFSKGVTTKIESEKIERDIISPTSTPVGFAVAGKRITVSGELEFIPGGTNSLGEVIRPDCFVLLKACGFEEKDFVIMNLDNVSGFFETGEIIQNASTEAIGIVYFVLYDENDAMLFCIKEPTMPSLFENDTLTGVNSNAVGQLIGLTEGETLQSVVAYSPSNTGDGNLSISGLDGARVGDYVLVVTEAAVSGSEVWSVVDPDGNNLLGATTGVAYSDQIDFYLESGGTGWAVGDKITLSVSYGAAVETGFGCFPVTDKSEHKSVTIVDNIDGTQKRATYCRGNVTFNLKVKDYLRMSFDFTGIYNEPTSAALIDANFSENEPIICNPALFNIGNLKTNLAAIETFELNLNNEVQPVDDIQQSDSIRAVFITNRAPSGSVNPTTVGLDVWNPFDEWRNHQRQTLSVGIGREKGKRVRIIVPEAQLEVPDDTGDRNGVQVTSLNFLATGRKKQLSDREMALVVW
jgi:hypothetical protein